MINTMKRALARRALLVLSLAGAVAACDNPVGDGEEHADAVRVVVLDAQTGQEVASATSTTATGSIAVKAGAARELRVNFVDAAGAVVQPDGSELSLRGLVTNTGIARFEKTSESTGRLSGVATGSTSVVFDLMHGSHPDFTGRAIPVTVTQ